MKSRAYIAEFTGSFAFFVIGAGAICADNYTQGQVGLLGIALAHGIILSIMVSAFGHISGGHFNPAVSIGLFSIGKMNLKDTAYYIFAQLLGGVCAGFVLRAIFIPDVWEPVHLGTPGVAEGVSFGTATFLEAVMTFFLLLAVLLTMVDSRSPKIAGFGYGLTLMACILVGGPITGASLNPARTFGPALVANFWDQHLVYWIGPIIGGVIACLVYKFVFEEK